jgi:hypothetical protein
MSLDYNKMNWETQTFITLSLSMKSSIYGKRRP